MRYFNNWQRWTITLTVFIYLSLGLTAAPIDAAGLEERPASLLTMIIDRAYEYTDKFNKQHPKDPNKKPQHVTIPAKTKLTTLLPSPLLAYWEPGAHQPKKPFNQNLLEKPNTHVTAPSRTRVIRAVSVMATGYTAGYESTGKNKNHPSYGITYSGVKVRRDKQTVSTIAADLKVFPLGTILYIPGYGYGVVADKGSAIKGQKIDLYFSTIKQVYKEWGKKKVTVQVVKRGQGKLTESMLQELGQVMQVNKEIPLDVWDKTI